MTLRSDHSRAPKDEEGELQGASLTLLWNGMLLSLNRNYLFESVALGCIACVLTLSFLRSAWILWRGRHRAPERVPGTPLRLRFFLAFPSGLLLLTVGALGLGMAEPRKEALDMLWGVVAFGLLFLVVGIYWWRRTWRLRHVETLGPAAGAAIDASGGG